jgi:hypothetical protein
MSKKPELEPIEKPSYLDGILSMQFDECSIAASHAAEIALNIAATRPYKESPLDIAEQDELVVENGDGDSTDTQVYPDNGFNSATPTKYVPLFDALYESPLLTTTSTEASLVLEQSKNEYGPSTSPRLLFLLGDIAMPIASFEQRVDGQCSYVQIGDEVHKDNIVAVPGDTRTSSVEELRELLKIYESTQPYTQNQSNLPNSLTLDKHDRLKAVIDEQVKKRGPELLAKYSGAIRRTLTRLFEDQESESTRNLHFMDDGDGSAQELDVLVIEKFDNGENRTGNDRYARLALVRAKQKPTKKRRISLRKTSPETDDSEIRMVAITRDNIAVPMYSFTESQILKDSSDDGSHAAQAVSDANELIVLRDILSQYETLSNTGSLSLQRNQLARLREKDRSRHSLPDFSVIFQSTLFNPHANRYLAHEDKITVYEVFDAYDKRLSFLKEQKQKLSAELLESSGAMAAFNSNMGEHDATLEKLVLCVGRIATNTEAVVLSGAIHSRKIGKTESDVDITATITPINHGTDYHVVIDGRPTSLVGMHAQTIFDETVHKTTPNTDIDPDKAAEMYGLLTVIRNQ